VLSIFVGDPGAPGVVAIMKGDETEGKLYPTSLMATTLNS